MASRVVDKSLLLFIFLALGCLCGVSEAGKGRIVGGYKTDISTAKYAVQIFLNGTFNCGGSLITSTHVLTAAHCVINHDAKDFEVVGGSTYLNGGVGESREVDSIITPSTYNATWQDMDVAVLCLIAPMIGADIETIKLCSNPVPGGDKVKIFGWGDTKFNGTLSNQLRSVELPVVSKADCQRYFSDLDAESMLCVSEASTKSICNGDSGSPAVYNNELCGIVSIGLNCTSWPIPSILTDVYKVREFIKNAISSCRRAPDQPC